LKEALDNARTLENVFSSLHILQVGGTVLDPPVRIDPQDPDLSGRYRDISADRWPYLAASRGGFNVAGLFTNGVNSDALNCALTTLQYSEGQGKAVADKIDGMRSEGKSDSDVQGYLGGLSAKDQRNYEIYNTLRFIHQFDKGPDSLDKDGDFGVISREDLTNWAEGLDNGQGQGEKAVVRLHVILGLTNYFANPPSHALVPDAGVPDAGPKIVVSTVPTETPPSPPTPPPAPAAPTGSGMPDWLKYVIGGGVGAALMGLYRYFSRNTPPQKAHPDAKAAIRRDMNEDEGIPKPKEEKKPRVVSDTTAPKAAPEKTGPKVVKTVIADDIAGALSEIDRNASPAGGARLSGAPSIDGVSPENVIINGTSAEPVAGVTPTVVRAQIALHYRHFLSQAAREALAAGRPLPADGELVASAFTREVQELTDRVIAEYHRMATTEPEALREMWTTQREDGRPIVRRGAPQRMIMSVVGDYISAESLRAGSPFEGGVGTEVRREAERRAGETDFFEKGMKEILKDPARLGR
jgi:hypothetical protein